MTFKTTMISFLGQSPISSLQAHMTKAQAAVEALLPFIDAIEIKDWQRAAQLQLHITQFEHQANEIKRELRLHLPQSLFALLPRGDLLSLLSIQDGLANRAEDIAELMTSRRMELPPTLIKPFKVFLHRAVDASTQAAAIIANLDSWLQTGFQHSDFATMEKMVHDLDEIEEQTDDHQDKMRHLLFELESELPAVHVIFLYKIIEWVDDLADRSRQIGDRLQLMLSQ